jgi:hypothetical protein
MHTRAFDVVYLHCSSLNRIISCCRYTPSDPNSKINGGTWGKTSQHTSCIFLQCFIHLPTMLHPSSYNASSIFLLLLSRIHQLTSSQVCGAILTRASLAPRAFPVCSPPIVPSLFLHHLLHSGPSAYGAPKLPPPGGGKFSTAVAKSDIDWMVYVACSSCFVDASTCRSSCLQVPSKVDARAWPIRQSDFERKSRRQV